MNLEVVEKLEEKEIPYRIIQLEERAISVKDVIKYSKQDLDPKEICKTIILQDLQGEYYAAFLKGNDRVDLNKASKYVDREVKIANLADVRTITRLEPGAICPILLDMPILLDKRVLKQRKINFGSGNLLYGIEVNPNHLEKIIDYKVVKIAK